jgi:hypothetical protein
MLKAELLKAAVVGFFFAFSIKANKASAKRCFAGEEFQLAALRKRLGGSVELR